LLAFVRFFLRVISNRFVQLLCRISRRLRLAPHCPVEVFEGVGLDAAAFLRGKEELPRPADTAVLRTKPAAQCDRVH
jgi:hypothetical protein